MANYSHPAWIEVDLKQLKKNISILRGYIGKRLFCFPVKANAYGHGLVAVSKAAQEAGIDYLAVAHLQEAVALRNANISIPILVLGAIHEEQIEDLIDFDLEFTLSSHFKAELVKKKCQSLGKTCRVHLEVDTGMQRTGMRSTTAKALFATLRGDEHLNVVGIYSHFATADTPGDSFATKQIATFQDLLADPLFHGVPLIRHLGNSGGTLFFPHSHLDMVRPSLATLGYLPPHAPAALEEIAPCFSLKARVSYFKVVPQGEGISYGHSYITPTQTRVVTIPVGYGDGYRRALSNKGSVLIRGKKFPIVGTICMDQFMVDVGTHEVHVGDEAVLIGKQGTHEIPLTEIATLCDTIPYEILCLFNDRLPRLYP